jgi:hypothetical protein
MEHCGAEYAVILHDPDLRDGLIREAQRSRRSPRIASGNRATRRWLAAALRGVASRIEPVPGVLDPRAAPGGVVH